MANRIRNFGLVSYIQDSNLIQSILDKHITSINRYAYALHDKDTENPHHHILIWTHNALQYNTVRKWFLGVLDENNKECSCLCKPIQCDQSAYEYLTHKNEKDKFIYDESIIKSFNVDINAFNDDINDDGSDIVEMLINKKPLREIVKLKGKEFIYHYKHYRDLADEILKEDRRIQYERYCEIVDEFVELDLCEQTCKTLDMPMEKAFPNLKKSKNKK